MEVEIFSWTQGGSTGRIFVRRRRCFSSASGVSMGVCLFSHVYRPRRRNRTRHVAAAQHPERPANPDRCPYAIGRSVHRGDSIADQRVLPDRGGAPGRINHLRPPPGDPRPDEPYTSCAPARRSTWNLPWQRTGGSADISCRATSIARRRSSEWRKKVTITGSMWPSPGEYAHLVVMKGSICINGISLTVAGIQTEGW